MAAPHILLARMSHETNTFSPVVTDLPRFSGRAQVPPEGAQAREIYAGSGTCLGGFIDVCDEAGATYDIAIGAGASPSGRVENDAFEYMAGKIVAAAVAGADRYDGIMLDLHGAMVTKTHEDGEGELLRRVRAAVPDLPVAVALDMHANLFPDMVDCASVISGYHEYPHTDTYQTGRRSADVLLKQLAGSVQPTMTWANLPMLPHVMRQGTDDLPNKALQERAAQMEAEGALAVSLFTGFPHADISNAGLSVVVVTDNDPALAQRYRDELLDAAWAARQAFVYQLEDIQDSMARARAIADLPVSVEHPQAPVLLMDHYDNSASGGTMDTTEVLAEILAQGLEDVAVFAIYDPAAVEEMVNAGVGAEVTVAIGGKTPMPELPQQSKPLTVTGRVRTIVDGRFEAVGAANSGTMDMGRSVVLDTGKVEIVVISRFLEPFDPGVFTSVGILPERKRYLMLKSRIHYRRGFKEMARGIVECAGIGVCTSDYSQLEFKHVRRPVFPLDGINSEDWRDVET